MPAFEDVQAHDRFVLRQRIRPVINQYELFLPGPGDGPGEPICFVEQKRFRLKEDIRFYADDLKSREVMRIKARRRFDPVARYDVTDARDVKIGEIQKVFTASLIRSTYVLADAEGSEIARVSERSLAVALFRRLAGLLPFVGDFADWLPIPYHFNFMRGDQLLGTQTRRVSLRDVYVIDLGGDPQRTLDRRLVLALAVGLDALQAR
jgi:hypothetical protein